MTRNRRRLARAFVSATMLAGLAWAPATGAGASAAAPAMPDQPAHLIKNPRFWKVQVPRPPSGKRAGTLVEGAFTTTVVLSKGREVRDRVRVRTGKAYVRRVMTVERRRLDVPSRWIVADRGLTTKKGRFNADLVAGGLGTWQFRFGVRKEPGARKALVLGGTLQYVSGYTAAETLWDQISAGGSNTCALATTGKPYCWGHGGFGANGNGGLGLVTLPSPVTTGGVMASARLIQISVGDSHACALDSDGRAYCWGAGASGQLGDGRATDARVPVRVDSSGALKGVQLTSLSAGTNRTCAVGGNGNAYCWGAGGSGALGTGQSTDAASPVAVDAPPDRDFVSVSTDGGHTCAIQANGTAWCWGAGDEGQLGNGGFESELTPDRVKLDQRVSTISVGERSTCATTSDGVAYCWGASDRGRLGGGETSPTAIPTKVLTDAIGASPMARVVSADAYSCALTTNAAIACWGVNRSGQLGLGHTTDADRPQAVPGLANVRELSAGTRHACAVTSDGKALCWGNDANGELGNASWGASNVPFPVAQPLS